MAKVLFIHPLGVNATTGGKDISSIANIMAPLGLCSLAAWLDKFGPQAEIHDCYAFPGEDQKMLSHIRKK